ncbi:hypothetical protein HK44_020400 [Pseudomonas fluorescens HK44]|uniref:Uncharacterized protein n=1 Tax=Pseudomonas fluorescens HK44 TaxID=1042209 RepID=A0A010TGS1_PSEFL|nr:hypothetical protein [Pseudomonas fluorescens]EXF96272.1 hypothetical protein HK44_020400 [Pseudomonas fluorescens HK44]
MTTSLVKTLIDEELEGVLKRPRETLVCELECPVKGSWRHHCRDNGAFMEGDWDIDPRGRLVEVSP